MEQLQKLINVLRNKRFIGKSIIENSEDNQKLGTG